MLSMRIDTRLVRLTCVVLLPTFRRDKELDLGTCSMSLEIQTIAISLVVQNGMPSSCLGQIDLHLL